MAKTSMWMVRAGEAGYQFDRFQKEGIVAIGWDDLGDLSAIDSQEKVRELYDNEYSDDNEARVSNAVAMVFKFRCVLKPGHKVTTYNPETRQYLVGTIKGEYQHVSGGEYHHVRSVDWLGLVDRDSLKAASRNSLGSTLTLFQLNDETADDLLNALQGTKNESPSVSQEKQELEQLKEDTASRALELIKDKILKLNDEELELLVAALLRAMGYKVRVTPKGPDRGVDVIASPDGLGLEEPRIKAQVKHRPRSQMGAQDIRSFLGGLRQGDRGLYVSTGGFSKDAGYEADRSNIPITLLNLEELASLIVTHYENFDMNGKVLIPLTRLYWPVE
jgi:restriction system protein